MDQKTLKLTCSKHSQAVTTLLLRPGTQYLSTSKELTLQYCCQSCLMEIPSLERNRIPSLSFDNINRLFQKFSLNTNPLLLNSLQKPQEEEDNIITEELTRVLSPFIILCRYTFLSFDTRGQIISDKTLILALQKLIHPFEQKLIISKGQQLTVGKSDFSFESCLYLPEKFYLFVGNRIGELFVVNMNTKDIIKEFSLPARIGAVKHIPEKKTVIVSGLRKSITKINPETLEIIQPTKSESVDEQGNFLIMEYISSNNLLFMGGDNLEHSIELYNYDDLTLVKTIDFNVRNENMIDLLATSLLIESGKRLILGSQSGTLQLWKPGALKLICTVSTFTVLGLEYHKEEKLIYTGHLNGLLQIWKIRKLGLQKVKSIQTGAGIINKIKFLKGEYGKYMIMSIFKTRVSVWSYMGSKVDEIEIFQQQSRSILVIDNENIVSTGVTPGIVYFFKVSSKEEF